MNLKKMAEKVAKNHLEESVKDKTNSIIENIKTYCINQREDWAQVYELAKGASSKFTANPQYKLAAEKGYWAIQLPSERDPVIYVELKTGNLLNGRNTSARLEKSDLMQLATSMDKLDTERIIANLENLFRK